MPIITNQKPTYNQVLHGVFGEFGQGGGAQIFFLQTVIRPKDLDKIALVGDIEGSEKWEVRDLFQRDVDLERVSGGLVPYLLDQNSIKFFNPLTLTFIPPSVGNNSFASVIQTLDTTSEYFGKYEYQCIDNDGKFRFRHVTDSYENGVVEWNDSETKLVAIDGQHRLSALKNISDDIEGRQHIDFDNWSIPVVIFGVRSIDEERTRDQRTLDIIRRTFVYINTEAKAPTETRQILLNDSLVNEICTQEFVQYYHSNDCESEPDPEILPLFVFNWRGAQTNSRTERIPGTLQSVAELRDWMEHYVLGENWSADQQQMLGIEVVGPTRELKEAFNHRVLKPSGVKALRDQFNINVLPGLTHMLQQFEPIKKYGTAVRNIEIKFNEKSTEARHAFAVFRFGNSKAHSTLRNKINSLEIQIIEEISDAYSLIPSLLQKDIGMRGVMFAYGNLYKRLNVDLRLTDFEEYSVWFTKKLNQLSSEGWFGPFSGSLASKATKEVYQFHKHITTSHTDAIVNYRLNDSKGAFGGLLTMIIASKAALCGELEIPKFNSYYGAARERIQSTLIGGYKKEVRPGIQDSVSNDTPVKQVNSLIKKEAEKRASKHLANLENYIGIGDI
jgi:hypothetical protein